MITKQLILNNDVQQISLLEDYINDLAAQANIDYATTFNLNLALEEAVTNVLLYAYPEQQHGTATIDATITSDRLLTFVITDQGKAFDPTQRPDPDITLSAEQRQIGGLGIHLVRQIMDSVSYQRQGQNNILTMTKKL